jgi:hypothetical protein
MTLTQESLEKASSIQRLEDAATELYKALQAGRDIGKPRCDHFPIFVRLFVLRYGRHNGKA